MMLQQSAIATGSHIIPDLEVRSARLGDLPALEALIAQYTSDGTLLPRTRTDLLQHLHEFRIVAAGDLILACGALQPCDRQLAEIRTIAVQPGWQATGLGHRIVAVLLTDARHLGFARVACLTRRLDFFAQQGFAVMSKDLLPSQFWASRRSTASKNRPDKVAMQIFL